MLKKKITPQKNIINPKKLTAIMRQESNEKLAPLYFLKLCYFVALGEENYAERGRGASDSRMDRLLTIKAHLWASLYKPALRTKSLKCHLCFFMASVEI